MKNAMQCRLLKEEPGQWTPGQILKENPNGGRCSCGPYDHYGLYLFPGLDAWKMNWQGPGYLLVVPLWFVGRILLPGMLLGYHSCPGDHMQWLLARLSC